MVVVDFVRISLLKFGKMGGICIRMCVIFGLFFYILNSDSCISFFKKTPPVLCNACARSWLVGVLYALKVMLII